MTAPATTLALDTIEAELSGIPEDARSVLAEKILGALDSRFLLIPYPTADEDAETQRLADALMPEVMRDLFPAKGRAS